LHAPYVDTPLVHHDHDCICRCCTVVRGRGSAETFINMSSGGSKTGGTRGGIHAGRWNPRTGTIVDYRQVADISTSFMTISHHGDDRFLYAGHQTGKGVGGVS